MLTGREAALFKGAFGGKTTLAFEIKFFAFAPAKFTNRT
jgi:hypothetical protein